jgi:aspartate aminotransferase-like enzyme
MVKPLKLFTPGPVDLGRCAGDTLAQPIVHHRSQQFEEAWSGLGRDLKRAFGTEARVAVLTSSGTGAMEALVANLLAPGDRVLVPVAGKFSRRWAEICETYGVEASRLELAAGESPSPELVADALRRNPSAAAVLLTHCESSTGALTDLGAVAAAVRDVEAAVGRPILVCVDAVTSLCVDPLSQDAWGIDAAVGASQKGLLAPPGLAFVTVNARAREAAGRVRRPRYYFDLARYLDAPRPPFTPAVPVVLAVRACLAHILGLGLEKVWKANAAAASALRAVVCAAGLKAVATRQSGGVVGFWTAPLEADPIARALRADHGIVIGGGQDDLKGKVLRVSGIGKGREDILFFAGAFWAVMSALGHRFDRSQVASSLERILEDTRIWQ